MVRPDSSQSRLLNTIQFVKLSIVGIVILLMSMVPFVQRLDHSYVQRLPPISVSLYREYGSTYSLTSSYGLFASMTTTRYEIILQGSSNTKQWKTYEFPYKPGDVNRVPPFVGTLTNFLSCWLI